MDIDDLDYVTDVSKLEEVATKGGRSLRSPRTSASATGIIVVDGNWGSPDLDGWEVMIPPASSNRLA